MNKKTNCKKPVPCFKRWSRKSYGIFASLHRYVTIGVLSVGMSIILLATSLNESYAADTLSTEKRIRLDSAEIIGNHMSPTRSAMSQTIFYNRKNEAAAPFQTLESVLRVSPSFDIRERGGKGIQTDISIRGGSFDQTMVMLNGINFTDARTGHQTHSLPIDIESIAGIDLIDGVSGIGAYAGAINFRTQPLYPKYLRAEIIGGDHGYLYSNLSGAYKYNSLQVFGAASYRQSNGYRVNTDFSNTNIYLRVNYEGKKLGFLDFQAGYQNRDFGANGFYSLKYPEQFEHTNTFVSSIRWIRKIGNNLTFNLISSYRRNHDRFELIKDNPSKVPYNYHLTDNLGEELWIDYKSKIGTISFGGDFTYNHIYSTVLGEKLQTAKGKYTKGKSREIGNIWARYKKNFSNFNISSSIGMSSTPYGQSAIWSISGGYNTNIDDNSYLKFDIGAAQSMRLPTFTDLYYTTTGYIGNPNLKPERAITYKLGTSYISGKIQTSITGYYREGKDIIDWVKKLNEEDWQSKQITTLNTFGIEFLSKYISNNGFLRMASLSYGYITTDKHSENKISKYALDYMRNKISCSVRMALHRNISLTAIGTLFDRSGKYTNQYGNIEAYKPYFLLDARIMYNIKFLSLYLDGTNLTSTKYFDYGGLEMPKIWASGGIIITLK